MALAKVMALTTTETPVFISLQNHRSALFWWSVRVVLETGASAEGFTIFLYL